MNFIEVLARVRRSIRVIEMKESNAVGQQDVRTARCLRSRI